MTPHKPLALTMGEPAGISAEITLKAWAALARPSGRLPGQIPASTQAAPQAAAQVPGGLRFFVIDDPARLARTARALSLEVPVSTIETPAEAARIFETALPVLPLDGASLASLEAVSEGAATTGTAGAVTASIERGVALCLDGEAAGLVTNPIQKEPLMQAGFAYPGHTEHLGALLEHTPVPEGVARGPVMMLAAGDFRVVPVTTHIPLAQVAGSLTRETVVRTAHVVAQALVRDFGCPAPRLAICGLNPHAGEGGMIGREEIDIISPAVTALQQNGIAAMGPVAADSMFHEAARQLYDAAITMYHDQALIPIKTSHFFSAVNITLGLPIIRTSPDHGTGLNIAGKGVARADSLINALVAADGIATMRRRFDAAYGKTSAG